MTYTYTRVFCPDCRQELFSADDSSAHRRQHTLEYWCAPGHPERHRIISMCARDFAPTKAKD